MSKEGTRIQKALLRKLAKDERLHPNKRLLATLLLGVIDKIYPLEFVESVYNNPKKINWDDKNTPIKSPETQTKLDTEAKDHLRSIFAEVLEEDDAADSSSN